jgi:hypothetical protein
MNECHVYIHVFHINNIDSDPNFSEDDEPVVALDLRIGKAVESITIFDDRNVLGPEGQSKPGPVRNQRCSNRFSAYEMPDLLKKTIEKGKPKQLMHIMDLL